MSDKELLDKVEELLDTRVKESLSKVKETDWEDGGHDFFCGQLDAFKEVRDLVTLQRNLNGKE